MQQQQQPQQQDTYPKCVNTRDLAFPGFDFRIWEKVTLNRYLFRLWPDCRVASLAG